MGAVMIPDDFDAKEFIEAQIGGLIIALMILAAWVVTP